MTIPIVFFHIGSDDYFKDALTIACKKNKVIHIGNVNLIENENYEFLDVKNYQKDFQTFVNIYDHMHPRQGQFETICFLRWIALRNLMNDKKISNAFYADSDVAILCNVNDEYDRLGKPETAFSIVKNQHKFRLAACGHVSYWSLKSINELFQFIIEAYKNLDIKQRLIDKYSWHLRENVPGGVCDMSVFYLFSEVNNIFKLNQINDDCVFDENINSPENFESDEFIMEDGLKKIIFNNGKFFGFAKDGKKIQFKTLHMQGGAKPLLHQVKRILELHEKNS